MDRPAYSSCGASTIMLDMEESAKDDSGKYFLVVDKFNIEDSCWSESRNPLRNHDRTPAEYGKLGDENDIQEVMRTDLTERVLEKSKILHSFFDLDISPVDWRRPYSGQ